MPIKIDGFRPEEYFKFIQKVDEQVTWRSYIRLLFEKKGTYSIKSTNDLLQHLIKALDADDLDDEKLILIEKIFHRLSGQEKEKYMTLAGELHLKIQEKIFALINSIQLELGDPEANISPSALDRLNTLIQMVVESSDREKEEIIDQFTNIHVQQYLKDQLLSSKESKESERLLQIKALPEGKEKTEALTKLYRNGYDDERFITLPTLKVKDITENQTLLIDLMEIHPYNPEIVMKIKDEEALNFIFDLIGIKNAVKALNDGEEPSEELAILINRLKNKGADLVVNHLLMELDQTQLEKHLQPWKQGYRKNPLFYDLKVKKHFETINDEYAKYDAEFNPEKIDPLINRCKGNIYHFNELIRLIKSDAVRAYIRKRVGILKKNDVVSEVTQGNILDTFPAPYEGVALLDDEHKFENSPKEMSPYARNACATICANAILFFARGEEVKTAKDIDQLLLEGIDTLAGNDAYLDKKIEAKQALELVPELEFVGDGTKPPNEEELKDLPLFAFDNDELVKALNQYQNVKKPLYYMLTGKGKTVVVYFTPTGELTLFDSHSTKIGADHYGASKLTFKDLDQAAGQINASIGEGIFITAVRLKAND